MTEKNAPIMLQIVGEACGLLLYHKDGKYNSVNMFRSVNELLCIFLNGEHEKMLFPENEEEQLLTQGVRIHDSDAYRAWLGNYDHERLLRFVHDIYSSDNKHVEFFKPSQRLRIYLSFDHAGLVTSVTEQTLSHVELALSREPELLQAFQEARLMMLLKAGEVTMYEDFCHACQFLREHEVDVPEGICYMFAGINDLVYWLLRYVIERDRYIKRCEFCGKYFIPKRSSKKYCSEVCSNKQRTEDSFCGVTELRSLYKRIVANLTNKEAQAQKHQLPYYNKAAGDATWVRPMKVLKEFYSENADYMNELRDAYEAIQKGTPSENEVQRWENCKRAYLDWMQKQYDYASSLKLFTNA